MSMVVYIEIYNFGFYIVSFVFILIFVQIMVFKNVFCLHCLRNSFNLHCLKDVFLCCYLLGVTSR